MKNISTTRPAQHAHCRTDADKRIGITGVFFSMPRSWQRQRIRELVCGGMSVDLIAAITGQGIGAVQDAIGRWR